MPTLMLLQIAASAAGLGGQEAQPSPVERDQPVEEIIVTGERISRTLRQTPSSVVVFTESLIDTHAGADRLDQLLEQVPNVQFGSGGQGPTVRGQDSTGVLQDLPAFLGGTRPRVTVQVDGRAVSYNEFVNGVAPLWDVERVEAFRSPQSTTQGRNSIAGAIFIYTNDPTFDWEARGRLIHGNFDTWQGSALVSGPIVEGQLAFRLTGDARTSRIANKTIVNVVGANPNRDRYGTFRAKLLAEPAALPGFRLEASYAHLDSRQPPAEGVNPPFTERRRQIGTAVFDSNVDSLTAEARYDVAPSLKLIAILSTGWVEIQRYAPPGLGVARTNVNDRSLETLLDWRPSEQLKGRLGFHWLQTRLDQFIDLTRVFGLGEFDDRQASLGAFGEIELRPAPKVTMAAGLRYQRDRQDRDGFLGNPLFPTFIDFDRSFDAWLPKISLAYDFADGITAGLLVQRAYNPGGTTINFDEAREKAFGAETLWSFELFGRARLAEGRLWLTANLFRNELRNAQRAEPRAFEVPGQGTAFWSLIHNLPTARSHGLEASVDWRATDRLQLRGGVGLLHTRIGDNGANPFDGKQFARAPTFTGTASMEWRPVQRLKLNADIRHNSGYFSDDLNTLAFRIRRATVVNARAAFRTGRVTFSAYGRNLYDDFYLTSQSGPNFATAGDPREVGVGIEMSFLTKPNR